MYQSVGAWNRVTSLPNGLLCRRWADSQFARCCFQVYLVRLQQSRQPSCSSLRRFFSTVAASSALNRCPFNPDPRSLYKCKEVSQVCSKVHTRTWPLCNRCLHWTTCHPSACKCRKENLCLPLDPLILSPQAFPAES